MFGRSRSERRLRTVTDFGEFRALLSKVRRGWLFRVLWFACLTAAVVWASFPLVLSDTNAVQDDNTARLWEKSVSGWPSVDRATSDRLAGEYNDFISATGQRDVGTAFNGDVREEGNELTDDRSRDAYNAALNPLGDGVMGVLSIPDIGVTSRVWHGTENDVLEQGVGHLYGTSLPTGLPGTRSVLAAHNGLPDRMLFTRIDELHEGSLIKFTVAGKDQWYSVTGSRVVGPDDVDAVRINDDSKAVLTLLTCTPYGVNSHRLVVDAVATSAPDPEPTMSHTTLEMGAFWLMIGLWVLWFAFLVGVVYSTCVEVRDLRKIRETVPSSEVGE